MKARAIRDFIDKVEDVVRYAGDEFECSEERFEQINASKHGKLAERVRKPKKQEE